MSGISRIDSQSTHGWFVRAYKNKKIFSKLFSDHKYAGREKALEEAQKHRDALYLKLAQIPQAPRARRVAFRDSRNTTGVLGVSRVKRKNNKGGYYEYFTVSWRPEPGVQKCTSFSINKYGEKKAFDLAVAHRKKMLLKSYGPKLYQKLSKKQKEAQ